MYIYFFFFFFNDPRPTEIYPLPLHAALPISLRASYSLTGDKPAVTNSQVIIESTNIWRPFASDKEAALRDRKSTRLNSSHANISYAVFCLKKKKKAYHLHT